ncbi:hypothetical protein PDJAM_G00144030 [Pangasius djambal]|uniref:Uncharacterized protein n=1 Tax=Pangasius djambal TaxID=1691987 RepID=A0ACC5ZF56_9TELE|nr:hypothetical protein [Pangasius djambal]
MGPSTVLLILLGYGGVSTASHKLQYFIAVTPAVNFTSVKLDGEQVEYYNSNITKVISNTAWTKNIDADVPDYRESVRARISGEHKDLQHRLSQAVGAANHTAAHTYQWMYGCELDDDGTARGSDQYGYDGEDFISLDVKAGVWKPAKKTYVTHKWDPDGHYALDQKRYLTEQNGLKKKCIDWLRMYVFYSNESLERKVRPEASLFQKHSSPEVVCHATGFFPKAVMISWQKDGEDVHEDVELRETLPNQDGSFQKRSILRVPAEELQKHTYTCVIQHSSLEKELVLPVSERRILRGRRNTFL